MSEDKNGGPSPLGPTGPEIPDLQQRASQRAQPGFVWAADATLKPGGPGRSPAPSLLERLKPLLRAKAAVFTVLMGVGIGAGLGFVALTMLEVRPPDAPKDNGLGGIFSSLRVRPGGRDRMRYLAGKAGLFFGLSKADGPAPQAASDPDAAAAQAALEEGAPVGEEAPEAPAAPPAANSGAYMGGATAAAAAAGSAGGSGAPTGASPPNFNPAAAAKDAKASGKPRRSRGTLGVLEQRREVKGGKGPAGRTAWAGSASTRGGGAPGASSGAPSSLDFVVGGRETGASGPASGAQAAGGEQASGGSGGGPGGPGAVPDDAQDPNAVLKTIQSLLDKASAETKKAEKEKKIAAALALAGQHPQAAFHYDRGEKAEKKSKEYAAQAQKMAAAIGEGAQTKKP